MATEILRPSAAGDEESIQTSTSSQGYHWQSVDEEVPDNDASRLDESRATIIAIYII